MYRKPADGADITTWVLPNGATARLGRGGVSGKMAFLARSELLLSLQPQSVAGGMTSLQGNQLPCGQPKGECTLLSPFPAMGDGLPQVTGVVSLKCGIHKPYSASLK